MKPHNLAGARDAGADHPLRLPPALREREKDRETPVHEPVRAAQTVAAGDGGEGTDKTVRARFRPCLSGRASAVKVAPKRLPVFSFSGFDLYHHFRNDAFCGLYNLLKVQKTGKREVVLGQPLPQTLYRKRSTIHKSKSPIRRLMRILEPFSFADKPIFNVRHTSHMGVWLISVQQSAKDVSVTPNWS